jgi:hypothetical protein
MKVPVPLNTPITKRVPGEKEMLKDGTTMGVQGIQAADGTISASQITVSAGSN